MSRATKRSRFNTHVSKLREEYEAKHDTSDEDFRQKNAQAEIYKNSIFSCLVISPAGRTIKEFESIPELLVALRDAIKTHRSLLNKAKILHRDISENNIIITDPKMAGGYRWLGPASVDLANSMYLTGFLMYALEEACTLFMDMCVLPN